ncbi:hypothetical protein V6N13_091971 [Hibiscus sabdariffa]
MGERIGDRFGSTVAVDMRPGDGRWGEYLRIRVKLDISKPLRRIIFVGKREDGSSRACSVKYERLPNFCFWCGVIGHQHGVCKLKPQGDNVVFQYGDWLRVHTPRQGTIRVSNVNMLSGSASCAKRGTLNKNEDVCLKRTKTVKDATTELGEARGTESTEAASQPHREPCWNCRRLGNLLTVEAGNILLA